MRPCIVYFRILDALLGKGRDIHLYSSAAEAKKRW
jgi:hypothetical protein